MTNVIDLAAVRGERTVRDGATASSSQTESASGQSVPATVTEMLAPLEAALTKLEAATAALVATTERLAEARRRRELIAFAKKGAPPEE